MHKRRPQPRCRRRARTRLAIPISEHAHFKPTLRRIGLQVYVPDPAVENDGFAGGKFWQAQGELPKKWMFKSSKMIDRTACAILLRQRVEIEKAHADGKAVHCELSEVFCDEEGKYRRRVHFSGEDSGHTVNADHFEAMSRVILANGSNIYATRYLSNPRVVAAFNEDEVLVGVCAMRPKRL